MLSNCDFAEQIGKNLLIYPFKYSQMDSCSYDITASKFAWSLSTRNSTTKIESNCIEIPPQDTVVIVSQEIISLQKNLCGLCCSSVTLASSGLIMNTTPIKTGWIGKLLIAISNPTSDGKSISIGDKIAVLFVSKTHTPTNRHPQTRNYATQTHILNNRIQISQQECTEINDITDINTLQNKVLQEVDYQSLLKDRKSLQRKRPLLWIGLILVIILAFWVCYTLSGWKKTMTEILPLLITTVIANILVRYLTFKRD